MDQIQIQIRFTVEQDGHRYSDALYFSPEQYATITPAEIEALKQARYQSWWAAIHTPPVVTVPDPQFEVLNEDGTVLHV